VDARGHCAIFIRVCASCHIGPEEGSIRLCVDYRQFNKKIIKYRYQLSLVEDQLDLPQGARYFSMLNLKNGFFHVFMDKAGSSRLLLYLMDITNFCGFLSVFVPHRPFSKDLLIQFSEI